MEKVADAFFVFDKVNATWRRKSNIPQHQWNCPFRHEKSFVERQSVGKRRNKTQLNSGERWASQRQAAANEAVWILKSRSVTTSKCSSPCCHNFCISMRYSMRFFNCSWLLAFQLRITWFSVMKPTAVFYPLGAVRLATLLSHSAHSTGRARGWVMWIEPLRKEWTGAGALPLSLSSSSTRIGRHNEPHRSVAFGRSSWKLNPSSSLKMTYPTFKLHFKGREWLFWRLGRQVGLQHKLLEMSFYNSLDYLAYDV